MSRTLKAAALTPLMPAGIAVVRLWGEGAVALLPHLFAPSVPRATAGSSADRLRFGRLFDGKETLDDALVAVHGRPGRECVDLNVHGGPRVVQRLLLVLERAGATLVSGDEAASEAWPASNAIDRDVHACLPHAQTRRAAAWLLAQRELLPIELRRIRAMLNGRRLQPAATAIEALLAGFPAANRMLRGATVAIIGPPNAGKSTLANTLCGRDRVIVSDIPGTTRDYVTEPASLEGVPVTLVDTAGVRPTMDPLESEAIARAVEQARRADLRLLVLDASQTLTESARQMLAESAAYGPTVAVLNKSDLPARTTPADLPPAWGAATLLISAACGDGIDRLRMLAVDRLGLGHDFDRRAAVFTERQRSLAEQALSDVHGDPSKAVHSLDDLLGDGENIPSNG